MASKTASNIPTSADHLIKLKLVKEISLMSEVFKEAIVNIEVEENFLAELEAKKLKVSCLKKDHREHKEDKVAQTHNQWMIKSCNFS
ncbi:hypothetical protein Ahy_B05g078629 [Arachis hypogaea]|uniref:Uncharacterized protein n=1 Tax=Arachis hypogaea TaxID=3818 RepID=A0A444Z7K6_ARAHY|nr:hypothetical protein Ahy_B05g078629 [Arachis hypogaea]